MVLVAGFGNPLLDYVIKIEDLKFLETHNLKIDDSKEISSEDLKLLQSDIQNKYKGTLVPGGCAQNTLRILQRIIDVPNSTVIFGAIGNDNNGELLKDAVKSYDVNTMYAVKNSTTGLIISLVLNETRTLVGNIGASELYNIKDLDIPENLNVLKSVDLVYMEGFFITNRITTSEFILNFCKQNNIPFAYNLSAKYIISSYLKESNHFIEECDILFGNMEEFETLSKLLHKDVNTLAVDLCKKKLGKVLSITDGSNSVLCAHSGGIIDVIPIPKLPKEDIVDTTGAGDSFVAGFLACHLKQNHPLLCVKWGYQVAQLIIKQIGCDLPRESIRAIFNFH